MPGVPFTPVKKRGNNKTRLLGLVSGLLVAIIIILFTDLKPGSPEVTNTLAVALLMAVWWVTEAIPIAVTALLPVALFPVLGIMDGKDVSMAYFNHLIFLFIGGFIVALAMEKWNLHRRIALKILIIFGISPGRILMGFMLATAFLSMWMSNTATAMMMVPIGLSIVQQLEENIGKAEMSRYSIGLFLGIAYSASIGGIATLVGTPPNLSFARIFTILFPQGPEISFANWFIFALPITITMLIISWGLLYFTFRPKLKWGNKTRDSFHDQYEKLGAFSFEERVILWLFISLAFLWIFRAGISFDKFTIPGWASLFNIPEFINDGTVAIIIAIILFVIPSKNKKGERVMDWKTANKLPWHIVLLFGGGFALAGGFTESGLSIWFGEQLSWIAGIHPLFVIFCIALMMSFLTELTSNLATTEMILPIIAGIAVFSGINPLLIMVPATLAASLAFMLPVATPPNAIIFGTSRLRIIDMVKTGVFLNFIGILILTLFTYYYGTIVFDIDPGIFPEWGNTGPTG